MTARTLCYYHDICMDGSLAAMLVKRNIPDVKLIAMGHPVPESLQSLPVGDRPQQGDLVLVVDYCFNTQTLREMTQLASQVTVIDHHPMALRLAEELKRQPIERLSVVADGSVSGAMLTWRFFYPHRPAPKLVDYISRYDTGKDWGQLQPKISCLAKLGYQPNDWLAVLGTNLVYPQLHEKQLESLFSAQDTMRVYVQSQVELYLKNVQKVELAGKQTVQVNCPLWMANAVLSKLMSDHEFVASYFDLSDRRQYSLRSRKDGQEVESIAKYYGGGGHLNAAGFSIAFDDPKFPKTLGRVS